MIALCPAASLYLEWGYGTIGFMKSQVYKWLAQAEFQRIVDASLAQTRTVRILIALTYDSNTLIRWRALDAIGRCAKQLCATRSRSLKNLLRRQFWLMSDECGAISWHAPETIGEIVSASPDMFADFVPMTVGLLDLEPEDRPRFLPGILYALGRIGTAAPESVGHAIPEIEKMLTEGDAQARAMAVWCIGQIGDMSVLLEHPELTDDRGEAIIYRNEQLEQTTIGRLYDEIVG
jgi:hypothetical protein